VRSGAWIGLQLFLCILACHVEWHVREALAPLLFHDLPSRQLLQRYDAPATLFYLDPPY
jgi:hypothetical protein